MYYDVNYFILLKYLLSYFFFVLFMYPKKRFIKKKSRGGGRYKYNSLKIKIDFIFKNYFLDLKHLLSI